MRIMLAVLLAALSGAASAQDNPKPDGQKKQILMTEWEYGHAIGTAGATITAACMYSLLIKRLKLQGDNQKILFMMADMDLDLAYGLLSTARASDLNSEAMRTMAPNSFFSVQDYRQLRIDRHWVSQFPDADDHLSKLQDLLDQIRLKTHKP